MIVVERHRDGKLYPPGHHRSEADVARVASLCHQFRCRDGLSYRQIVARLASAELRVSIGSVHHYIRRFECSRCADGG
jgi:hypothetical protein